MLFALLLGCTPDLTRLYAEERATALSVASDVPSGWVPDAVIGVADQALSEAVAAAVAVAVSKAPDIELPLPLGFSATLKPQVQARKVVLSPSTACAACFSAAMTFTGNARWSAGPASGSVPITASATAIIGLQVRDASSIEASPKRVESLSVEVPSLGNLRVNASGPVQEWLRALLVERLPPIRIASLQTDALPIRAVRLSTQERCLRIEMLTDVPGAVGLRALPSPESGVEVAISESALTGLARRAAFKAGTLEMDVAADPRKLAVDGDAFTLDLRLWRLVGRGWYRDYQVKGTMSVNPAKRAKLSLDPTSAEETGQSPGALLVDPLAALFEARILEAIVGALDRSLPVQQKQSVAGITLRAQATEARGLDDALHLYGALEIVEP